MTQKQHQNYLYENAYLITEKRTFEGLPNLLSEVAREEISSLSDEIPECAVTYIPEVRLLLDFFRYGLL